MYAPEKMLQVTELSEEQLVSAYKDNSNIIVYIERWNQNKNRLEASIGEFKAIITLFQSTIYETDLELLKKKARSLVGNNVPCKILKIDFQNKEIFLSRKKSMEEANDYFKQHPFIKESYVKTIIGKAAFIDIGYGVIGKLKLHNYTNCIFNTFENAGLHEGDVIPNQIIGQTVGDNLFILSYKKALIDRDMCIIEDILPQETTVNCIIGEKLNDETGYFIDCLPNLYGIADTIRHDFLVDENGRKSVEHAIPPLETGRMAKFLIKDITKDKRGERRLRARFIKYI